MLGAVISAKNIALNKTKSLLHSRLLICNYKKELGEDICLVYSTKWRLRPKK